MSGKSYSIREMKTIVEYLTEHRAYSETRGRKMWMDFAASRLTNRTWQSLKECFIKRILPDITNPYFRLDPEQIHSFKRGIDLTEKNKHKLEFKPVDEQQNHKDENGVNGQPSTSEANNEANATGEDTTCSKVVHNRASTETLILDNCYETVDDIRMVLEKSTDDEQDKENEETKPQQSKSAAKSVRDFIVYSEPLTPMLQEVLDDFATDESDPPMEIDENYVNPDRRSNSTENAAKSQSILPHIETETAESINNNKGDDEDHAVENDQPNNDKGKQADENESASKTAENTLSQLEDVMVLVDEALAKHIQKNADSKNTEKQDKIQSSHDTSSVISDTLLPNNQEAINSCTFKTNLPTTDSNLKVSGKRKHSNSVEILESTKKRNVVTDQTVSKTDGNCEDKIDKVSSPKKVNNIENNNKIDSPKRKRKLTLNNTSFNTQTTRKPSVEQRKPSINNVDQEVNAVNDNSKNELSSTQTDNPCLKSVSLYDEQFSSTKYSDVDINDKEDTETVQKPAAYEQKAGNSKAEDDVILLKSRSNSESHDDPIVSDKPVDPSTMKLQKDKNLASIFGFANGSHSKRLNSRKRTTSHRTQHYESSESSDWTSASDSEYVSPPRGRRNRYARKYLKPHSARVRCLEDEGGLFVMLGKKIYPFVRDGKIIKNYVTYLPESDPEEEDSYWKSKYVEERKRTAELKKMVVQSKQNGIISKESSVSNSPPPKTQQNPKSRQESVNEQQLVSRRDSESVEKNGQDKTVKIKFTKFDQEVQLEGHWQHLNPVLAQVVSMLKEPSAKPPEPVNCVELSSGNTTPSGNLALDSGVHEKVNKMESDIFKEIQELDEQEKEIPKEKEVTPEIKVNGTTEKDFENSNVTVRKKVGRPKQGSTPKDLSPVKIKEPTESATKLRSFERVKEQEIVESTPNATKRKSRTPRKLLDVPNEAASTSKKSPKKNSPAREDIENESEEIRYKFPSPPLEKRRRKSANLNKKTKSSNHSKPKPPSPEALSRHSANSSQGYQDSDASPFYMNLRKKRRSSSTLALKGKKIQRKYRSKSYPLLKQVSDSSNSSFSVSFKTVTREQSTVNSEVYRSDSYQFLMPRTRAIMEQLQKIDETPNELNFEDLTALSTAIENRDNLTSKNEVASSSNVSMPSPELSLVESFSISRNALAIIGDDYPSMVKSPSSSELEAFDKYLMSGVDVSMPLMGQECGLRESYRKHIMSALSDLTGDAPNSAGRNLPSVNSSAFKVSNSESISGKVSNSIEETADSLDKRLEQLLLESVQKSKNNKPEKMEVDTQVKKKGTRKRCSTPNKKQTARKSVKAPSVGPLVEEECKTKCARTGRRSCPPSINIVYYENNAPDNLEINIHDQSVDVTTVTKGKSVKKDIIKVKISRPKRKANKKTLKENNQNVSRSSGHTEYDNESGVFLQGFDESADLIHNHSDTCLHVKDCMEGDSVEFLEMASKSIISVNSSEDFGGKENIDVNVVPGGTGRPELFCDDAQCAVDFRDEMKSATSGNTLFFTPLMSKSNSIITEDLSDASPTISKPEKSRPSKWYLVSEEETNYCDTIREGSNDAPSFGSNLKQIFPITCAIPDLSTITEMSDKNFNSCSPTLDDHLD